MHHRYQRHRWQTMGTILDCWQLKVNLKEKLYIYANTTTQSCPKEIMQTFLIEDFFPLPPVSTTPVVHLELRKSPWIFEKVWIGPNGIIRGLGESDPLEKLMSKISWHCPCNAQRNFQIIQNSCRQLDALFKGSSFSSRLLEYTTYVVFVLPSICLQNNM